MREQRERGDQTPIKVSLIRPELALEAICRERQLVLLGEPGAGKSTVLRYLALLLALRLQGSDQRLPGWSDTETPGPVVVPLGRVAALFSPGLTPHAALMQVIGDVLDAELRPGLREFLTPALRNGGVLLLCDGLDELPAVAADVSTRNPRSRPAGLLASPSRSPNMPPLWRKGTGSRRALVDAEGMGVETSGQPYPAVGVG